MRTPYQHSNRFIRYALFAIGWLSFVAGMIGLLLPVIPTSPFLILSAACFLRSSPRFYQWLTEHRWFGVYIRYYMDGEGIPRRVKILIITILWIMMLSSALLIVTIRWLSVLMLVIAAMVSIYIARQPEPVPKKKNISDV
ncbi:MAG: YbaN family protein [Spongiibacteraceae bacterium]